jgi:hypothetical protein
LLIVDQQVSHEAIDLLEEACKEDIHLFALPPHTTHALYPLDKAVFGTLKKHYRYNAACSEFMSVSPGNIVMKWTWPNLFSKAYALFALGMVICGGTSSSVGLSRAVRMSLSSGVQVAALLPLSDEL